MSDLKDKIFGVYQKIENQLSNKQDKLTQEQLSAINLAAGHETRISALENSSDYKLITLSAVYLDTNGNITTSSNATNVCYNVENKAINRIVLDSSTYPVIIKLPFTSRQFARDYVLRIEVTMEGNIPQITIQPPSGEEFTVESTDDWSDIIKGVNIISVTETYRGNS